MTKEGFIDVVGRSYVDLSAKEDWASEILLNSIRQCWPNKRGVFFMAEILSLAELLKPSISLGALFLKPQLHIIRVVINKPNYSWSIRLSIRKKFDRNSIREVKQSNSIFF